MLAPSTLVLAGLTAHAAAKTIPVVVGKNGLTFQPDEIQAEVGDVLEFRFYAKNHSVVAGDFSKACVPAEENGFFSGFFPTTGTGANSQVFHVTVSHTNPVPIYCSQNTGQHCKNGMVAVINPDTSGNSDMTLQAYKSLASQAGNAISPPGGVFGGQVAPNPNANSSSSASASAPSTTSSSSGGGAGGYGGGSGSDSGSGQTTAAPSASGAAAGGSSTTTGASASPPARTRRRWRRARRLRACWLRRLF
ncbi:16b25aa2-a6c8-4ff8-a8c7-ce1631159e3c [Thermothielavioides terrestris]|uniref:16b25aa2-a6c8-4ff8-a8c7-ce1631159e3c n=1 Tax=Thermothielavioides terrestris TaxID=2587410 RepID=A0A3S4ATF9_9PEZI|nr:16b25aa2-a6c8-4ff8-a8c7-ce1631159e3c [Thermothielavioides terrestris]